MRKKYLKTNFFNTPGNFVAYRPRTGHRPASFIIVSIAAAPMLNYGPWGFTIDEAGNMTVKNQRYFDVGRIERVCRSNHIIYKIPIAEHLL